MSRGLLVVLVVAAILPAVLLLGEAPVLAAESPSFVDVPPGHVFEADVEWMANLGITRGCNPPANDRFCPDRYVTRGQMAAFLTRALNLVDDGRGKPFVDGDSSVFEPDIARLAAAGITRGCNPPVNDRFCPDREVTRGQMAAFLSRALYLSDGTGSDTFVDDDDSVFEGDIERLAAAGITRGCNPPENDRFCSEKPVTRAQMAAFLHRVSTGGLRCLASECDELAPRVAPPESWEAVGGATYRVRDELVVVLDSFGSSAANRAYELAALFDAELVGGSPYLGAFQLVFASVNPSALTAARDALRLQDGVVAADYHTAVPALDAVPSEWSRLSDSEIWPLAQIGAPAAWEIQSDASSVAVLISDSGIFDDHEDLSFAQPPIRMQESAGPALRDSTHGTHVAGVACSTGNNATSGSRSAVGMAWGCELYGVDWNASGLRNLIDPLWAAHSTEQSIRENDIRVANMSWSVGPDYGTGCGRDPDEDDPADAWEAVLLSLFGQHPETLFVVSAGNCAMDLAPLVSEPFSTVPAAYGPLFPNVITVGSVDADGQLSSFSNKGESVEVYAPGGFGPAGEVVWGTTHACPSDPSKECTSAYDHVGSGTSQAAPLVTGLSALMFAVNPDATPSEVEACIKANLISVLGGPPTIVPADALECVATAPRPPPTPAISLSQGATAAAGYWYSVTLSNFPPNTAVTLRCHDSVDTNFYSQTLTTNTSGAASDSTLCYSGDGPDHWVTGGGKESNHVTWGASPPPPEVPDAPPLPSNLQIRAGGWCVPELYEGRGGCDVVLSAYHNALPASGTDSNYTKFQICNHDYGPYYWAGSAHVCTLVEYTNGVGQYSSMGEPVNRRGPVSAGRGSMVPINAEYCAYATSVVQYNIQPGGAGSSVENRDYIGPVCFSLASDGTVTLR